MRGKKDESEGKKEEGRVRGREGKREGIGLILLFNMMNSILTDRCYNMAGNMVVPDVDRLWQQFSLADVSTLHCTNSYTMQSNTVILWYQFNSIWTNSVEYSHLYYYCLIFL